MKLLYEVPLLSGRVLFLVLVLVSAHVAVYAVDCPTCQTSFGASQTLLSQNPTGFIEESAVGDFNGDSNLDLVAVTDKSQIVFLAGDGTGNFGAPVFSPLGVTSFSRSLAVGEFNGDGKLDLAVTIFSLNQVFVLLGNGAGAFSSHASLDTSVGSPRARRSHHSARTSGSLHGGRFQRRRQTRPCRLEGADGVTQIIVKLPEDFTVVGDKLVSLTLHNVSSNKGAIALSTVAPTN